MRSANSTQTMVTSCGNFHWALMAAADSKSPSCGRDKFAMKPGGLQLQLGPPPVTPLGVVPDGVARPHPE